MNKLDIREIMKALDDHDKKLWLQHRTEMRRSYIAAHANVIGIPAWDENDDAFLDLIDIKLALLFDRNGYINTTKTVVDKHDGDEIEQTIHAEVEANKVKYAQRRAAEQAEQAERDAKELSLIASEQITKSDATKSLEAGWGRAIANTDDNATDGGNVSTDGDKPNE